MQTKADQAILNFMDSILNEGDTANKALMSHAEFDRAVQTLLDSVRTLYDLDVVYIMKQVGDKYSFSFIYESTRRPEYKNSGIVMHLSKEGFDEVIHMYDDDPICTYNVGDMHSVANDVSDRIMHYGFVRKECDIYDGSIGFQQFKPHKWTSEERNALLKLGRLFKMIFSVPIAEGIQSQLLAALEAERAQYRNALLFGAEYMFAFDVTEGLIRERIITATGIDILQDLGFTLPASYDDVNAKFLEQSAIELIDDETKSCYSCAGLLSCYDAGVKVPTSEYYNSKTDSYIRVAVYLIKDDNTNHVNALVLANNVTEERKKEKIQTEKLYKAYNEANIANVAKTDFISNMSHDIRTPINGILGMLAIGEKNAPDLEKQSECRRKIKVAAEHLLSLINDVLDISKIESGTLSLKEEPFNIHELIDNTIEIVKAQAAECEVLLERKSDTITHPFLEGSPLHIRQVLINIIGNSIKYNKRGGFVRIKTTELGAKDGVALYRFEIKDNGIGMSKEYQAHLFEPFTQEIKDARTNYRGSGLGMAITKGLVEKMNGTISVKSVIDHGTKITIELPIKIGAEKVQNDDKDDEYLGDIAGMKILMAEDNAINAEIAEYMLKEAGATVVHVLNGYEVVETFSESKVDEFDAILMDIMMPIMNGLEAAKKIRTLKRSDAATIPIIALSANAFTEDEEKAKSFGMNDYLTKPLDTRRMLKTIASYKK